MSSHLYRDIYAPKSFSFLWALFNGQTEPLGPHAHPEGNQAFGRGCNGAWHPCLRGVKSTDASIQGQPLGRSPEAGEARLSRTATQSWRRRGNRRLVINVFDSVFPILASLCFLVLLKTARRASQELTPSDFSQPAWQDLGRG